MKNNNQEFDSNALCAPIVFYRTYSRKEKNRESFEEMIDRETRGLKELGGLTTEEYELVYKNHRNLKSLPSGRWMWVGGTDWLKQKRNYLGAYNCSSLNLDEPYVFSHLLYMACQGCGTGAVLEDEFIDKLPKVNNALDVSIREETGAKPKEERLEHTVTKEYKNQYYSKVYIEVGDSKEGWRDAYQTLIDLAFDSPKGWGAKCYVVVNLGSVRPKGEKLKGFGGISNPVSLADMFFRVAKVLNGANGRKLTAEECCLIIDEGALAVVAGSIRRSAGIKQFNHYAPLLKLDLWKPNEDGIWKIDPDRDALRMSNHSRNYHHKPSLEDIKDAVDQQYKSGEGAIFYTPEAIARCNGDLLVNNDYKNQFIEFYVQEQDDLDSQASDFLSRLYKEKYGVEITDEELYHRMHRYATNPCLEGDTLVLTKQGHFPIKSLVGKEVEVWDGNDWVRVNNFRVTSKNTPVYKVLLSNGQKITATSYHTFILSDGSRKELRNLIKGDTLKEHGLKGNKYPSSRKGEAAYLKGFILGQDKETKYNDSLRLGLENQDCMERLAKSCNEVQVMSYHPYSTTSPYFSKSKDGEEYIMMGLDSYRNSDSDIPSWFNRYRENPPTTEIMNWSHKNRLEFIAGYMDSRASAIDEELTIYEIKDNHNTLELLQFLLMSIGVYSQVTGEKDTYRLTIPKTNSIKLSSQVSFSCLPSFGSKVPEYEENDNRIKVVGIEYSHVAPEVYCCTVPNTHAFALSNGVLVGQCGEIIGMDFLCNLSEVHANKLDPNNQEEQKEAFQAAALSVVSLLKHEFEDERQQKSREMDPIIGASATGVFDFFVNYFGSDWLDWWMQDRDRNYSKADFFLEKEKEKLEEWKSYVYETVLEYCERHNLKMPNRYTCIKPSGTQSLLTGASPGWAPPKGPYVIRRINVSKDDPVAKAAIDCGYNIIPSEGDKDSDGNLLQDPYDSRVENWLIEVPLKTTWADIPNAENYDPSRFSAMAQFDFMMMIQNHYVNHNCSSTIETRQEEVEPLSEQIYSAILNNEGYVSATILGRFDDYETFPRLPIEPISREEYERRQAHINPDDFYRNLEKYDTYDDFYEAGPSGCDSDKCSPM